MTQEKQAILDLHRGLAQARLDVHQYMLRIEILFDSDKELRRKHWFRHMRWKVRRIIPNEWSYDTLREYTKELATDAMAVREVYKYLYSLPSPVLKSMKASYLSKKK